jgi:hypothetical protein
MSTVGVSGSRPKPALARHTQRRASASSGTGDTHESDAQHRGCSAAGTRPGASRQRSSRWLERRLPCEEHVSRARHREAGPSADSEVRTLRESLPGGSRRPLQRRRQALFLWHPATGAYATPDEASRRGPVRTVRAAGEDHREPASPLRSVRASDCAGPGEHARRCHGKVGVTPAAYVGCTAT